MDARTCGLLLAALAAGPFQTAWAQDSKGEAKANQGKGDAAEKKPTDEELLYRAFYLEAGLRDFAGATKTYEEALTQLSGNGKRDADGKRGVLGIRARLGLARCLRALGREDEAFANAQVVLKLDPENAEAKQFLASAAKATTDPALEQAVGAIVQRMLGDESARKIAVIDLVRIGDPAVPRLAGDLRSRSVSIVDGCAQVLVHLGTDAARKAVVEALRDPEVQFPAVLAEIALGATWMPANIPIFEALLETGDVMRRKRVADRIKESTARSANDMMAVPLLLRLTQDPALEVRSTVLRWNYDSTDVYGALQPFLLEQLENPVAEERAVAAQFAERSLKRLPRQEELIARLEARFADPDADVRLRAFNALWNWSEDRDRDRALAYCLARLGDTHPEIVNEAAKRVVKVLEQVGTKGGSAAREVRFLPPEIEVAVRQLSLRALTEPGWSDQARQAPIPFVRSAIGMSSQLLVELFVRAGQDDVPMPPKAKEEFRRRLLDSIGQRLRTSNEGEPERIEVQTAARDAFARIPDEAGQVQWLSFWASRSEGIGAECAVAVRSSNPRLRSLAYQRGSRSDATGATIAMPFLYDDARSGDVELAANAQRILGSWPRPEDASVLRELIGKTSGDAQRNMVTALASAAKQEAVPDLRGLLSAESGSLRRTALSRLARIQGVAAVDDLVREAEQSGAGSVLGDLVWKSGEKDDPSYSLQVEPAVLDQFMQRLPIERLAPDDLRRAANFLSAETLALMLTKGLQDARPYVGVRSASIEIAGEQHVRPMVPALLALLDDRDGQVRAAALQSLRSILDYDDVRRGLARAASGESASAAFEAARAKLGSTNALHRRGGALALGALGDPAAVGLLLPLLDDGDVGVREAAMNALERLGGKAALPPAAPAAAGDGTRREQEP